MARFIMSGIFSMHRFFVRNIHQQTGTTIQPVAIRSVEIFSAARITELLLVLNSMVRFILSVTTVYATLTLVFGLFAFSKKWSMALLDYTMNPLRLIFVSFVNFLPDLIAIIVIITVTRYLLTFIQFLFREVEKGTISFTGFYKEWSIPTYKIVRFLVLAFAVVVIFPYLPGSDTPFFQGISVFLGILISFGSTSAVSNFISGTLVTYMRPFRIGDRVRIADTEGDVIEKSLLVTRLRTIKNVEVTIPNSMVLGSHIINYSVNSRESGLILNTTATIGYDVPWNTVHQLLITAAEKTQYILQNPKPFVLQTALNDFSVVYEINAYTSNANLMANISSELRQNIQNEFNAAGVEILSPHFIALRDGTASTVRPKDKSGKNAPSGITVNVRSKK
jgi:small-conductance mechanosensitive channel